MYIRLKTILYTRLITKITARFLPLKMILSFWVLSRLKQQALFNQSLKKVSVSGESFGIKLYTDGVIIVGIRDVETDKGKCNPAKEAGLEKGDIIIEINGKKYILPILLQIY